MVRQGEIASVVPRQVGGRYEIAEVIGQGGTALVYRATELVTGRQLALKQLGVAGSDEERQEALARFEREYHTLAQLSHPSIIEVYDYGLTELGPYYTMELLDGGDLREQTPWPWPQACALLCDVCSSLALVHSRRCVHRDVTPRNVRCTRDGRAKLIDFGAMVPMGPFATVFGTPAFTAPEVLYRSMLDARTDLFSLGATLYYALTGRAAYPAREFRDLHEIWLTKPALPSSLVPGIPEALDALVMSLLSLEPALRPRTAAEVMQKLAVLSGLRGSEPEGVSRAYLATPVLLGRNTQLGAIRAGMIHAFAGHGSGIVIRGTPGIGRSRLLDACVLEAKTLGAAVVRGHGSKSSGRPFDVARAICGQLLEMLPDALSERPEAKRMLQGLEKPSGAVPLDVDTGIHLSRFILQVAKEHALAIVVDDVDRVDEASRALFASLVARTKRERLLVLAALEGEAAPTAESSLGVLTNYSTTHVLLPLDRPQIEELFCSVFGDVPNLGLVSSAIFSVSGGNPRVSLELAELLVNRGRIVYEGGAWTLPDSLDGLELPSSAEEALRQRLAPLSPLARRLATAQALASHDKFTREQCAILAKDAKKEQLERALTELVMHQVFTSDGRYHSLVHRGWVPALKAVCSAEYLRERHREIAELYERQPGNEPIYHLFEAGLPERALDHVLETLRHTTGAQDLDAFSHLSAAHLAATLERALNAAVELGRPAHEIHKIRQWLVSASAAVVTEESIYYRVAPAWLAQLERDSGLSFWREAADVADPGMRLMSALRLASERHAEAAESERVYRPDEAVRHLVLYVLVSIAIGTRTQNRQLLESLPGLLEPFMPLSPVIGVIRENALATLEARSLCQPERARARWTKVYEELCKLSDAELPHVDLVRHAVASGIGSTEAMLGLASATSWAELLERDPYQRVHALYLRKVVRLQEGDWEGAERLRREAEVAALEARGRQMFTTSILVELMAHALANDLTGVKQIIDRIEPLARRWPGWVQWRMLAEAEFERLRGDLEAACKAYEACLLETYPPDSATVAAAWPSVAAGYVETLVELGRPEPACSFGKAALETCQRLEIGVLSHAISRALALAEAKLGDYACAVERLDAVIQEQLLLGITGLHLGASCEARARVAIWAKDAAAFEEYAGRAAYQYRHGFGSPLGARYERLMDEARRSELNALPPLSELSSFSEHTPTRRASSQVTDAMRDMPSRAQRALSGLQLLCNAGAASSGYLYLFGETGLELVASVSAGQPSSEVSRAVAAYVERELDSGGNLARTQALRPSMDQTDVQLADPAGVIFETVPLRCNMAGQNRLVGVALLASPARLSGYVMRELAIALGNHFLELGDTRRPRSASTPPPTTESPD